MQYVEQKKPLFSGKDFSPGINDTTDMVVASLLRGASLRPGDVDDGWFYDYNCIQNTWLELTTRSYLLSNLADDIEEGRVVEYRKEDYNREWEPWLWKAGAA
jgi:hypothetical protein